MKTGWSEKVREVAIRDYVYPAKQTRSRVRIRFGDLKAKMLGLGFPAQNANQIASPIESEKFWEPLGLQMCSPKGQPRKVDTVFEFRFIDKTEMHDGKIENDPLLELAGILKGTICEGVDTFVREIRMDKRIGL
jgi:hypothetical protein